MDDARNVQQESKPNVPKQAFTDKPRPLLAVCGKSTDFQLPATVYTCSLIGGILFEYNNFTEWFVTCGEAYCRLFINILVQLFLLLAIYQIVRWQQDVIETGTDCYALTSTFEGFSLWVFFGTSLTEIFETCAMIEVTLRRIPTIKGTSETLLYSTQDGDSSPVLQSGGMSICRKVCVFMFVLLPKLALGIGMLIIGGLFLNSASSNTDILLNSLAAVFIIELDEMIFGFLTPAWVGQLIEELPPFESCPYPGWNLLTATSLVWKGLLSTILVAIFMHTAEQCNNDPCTGAIRTCPIIPFLMKSHI